MKVLKTDQQNELRALVKEVSETENLSLEHKSLLNYWEIELKPKRVRKTVDTVAEV